MNHSGDTNKMVGDTPRTDEQINGKPCTRFEILVGDSLRDALIPSQFARQLERELNAANSRIELLMSANADVARIAEERDAAEKRIRLLIAKLDKYQARIKRLEEAGDAMANVLVWSSGTQYKRSPTASAWRKAKEAKP